MNAIRSEWIKFSTLVANKVIWLVAFAFPVIVILLYGALTDDLNDSGDLAEMITGFGMFSVMLLSVLAVVAITGEYAHNTIRPTFAALPRRVVPLVAKTLVVMAVCVVTVLAIIAICWIGFTQLAPEPWGDLGWPFWDVGGSKLIPAVLGGLLVIMVGMVLFGLGAGMLIRNVGGAVALVLLWPLIAEGLLVLLFENVLQIDEANRFMPTIQGLSLIAFDRSDVHTERGFAAVYFLAWMVVVYLIGIWRTNRSDA